MPWGIFEQFDNWLTPAWPLTQAMHYALVKGSSSKFGGLRAFLSNWPLVAPADPCMTFDHINALHVGQEFFLPNLAATYGIPEQFDSWLTLGDTSNALHFGQGFFQSNLMTISKATWPLDDLWPSGIWPLPSYQIFSLMRRSPLKRIINRTHKLGFFL